MTPIRPAGVAPPASNYVHGMRVPAGERLVISGQIGITPDGQVPEGAAAQMEQAFANLIAVLAAAGLTPAHLVKITVFVTQPGLTALYRETRDAMLGGHACCATYLQVAGLAAPNLIVEVEGEAAA